MTPDTGLPRLPWPAASATGIGSMPGTDPAEAVAVVLGELPEFPHLPELPARGPGSDLTGRTACLLVDLPVETTPRGWKLTGRPGRDQRRAAAFLSTDLDALAEAAGDFGGTIKSQLCGPWTLAATLELSRSAELALTDPGAVADLTASLAEGAAAHVAGLRSRLPRAALVLQLDEPALAGVLAGALATASGLRRIRAVEAASAAAGLRAVVTAAGVPVVVHCCAPDVPFTVLREAGAAAAGFDMALIGPEETDALAESAEAGLGLFAGAVPAVPAGGTAETGAAARQAAADVIGLCRRIGLPENSASGQVVITPDCGLAGASAAGALAVLRQCRAAALLVPELIAEGA